VSAGWRRALAGVVLASARIPTGLTQLSRAAINGLWLGVLSDAALRALDERYYDAAAVYRSADWNEKGLFAWERELIEEHFAGRERIVVAACGGGREVLALRREGFDATGYEPHPGLAGYAARFLADRGHPGRAHSSPRDGFPTEAVACDGVVVGWGAYSLVRGRDRRVALLGEARRLLPQGGPVLLSFFARETFSRELRYTMALANRLQRLGRGHPIELGDTLAPNLVHVFTRAQLADELAAAGCDLVAYGVIGPADGGTNYAAAIARAE